MSRKIIFYVLLILAISIYSSYFYDIFFKDANAACTNIQGRLRAIVKIGNDPYTTGPTESCALAEDGAPNTSSQFCEFGSVCSTGSFARWICLSY